MKEKILPLALILAVNVIGTVIAVKHEINSTIIKRMVSQQDEILSLLRQKEGSIIPSDPSAKLGTLEKKIDALGNAVRAIGSKR